MSTAKKQLHIQGLQLIFPVSWTLHDSGSEISLRQSVEGGSITISTYVHEDSSFIVNAIDQAIRFIAARTSGDVPVAGSTLSAGAEFRDPNGIRWNVLVVAHRNRFALATYNRSREDAAEEIEAKEILNALALNTR